jgi:hypothetical protein
MTVFDEGTSKPMRMRRRDFIGRSEFPFAGMCGSLLSSIVAHCRSAVDPSAAGYLPTILDISPLHLAHLAFMTRSRFHHLRMEAINARVGSSIRA